jgi:hypothetical protein
MPSPKATWLARGFRVLHVATLASGLFFKKVLYHRIPVPRGEPIGGGDVLELCFVLAALATTGLVLLVAFVELVAARNWPGERLPPLQSAGLAIVLFVLFWLIEQRL